MSSELVDWSVYKIRNACFKPQMKRAVTCCRTWHVNIQCIASVLFLSPRHTSLFFYPPRECARNKIKLGGPQPYKKLGYSTNGLAHSGSRPGLPRPSQFFCWRAFACACPSPLPCFIYQRCHAFVPPSLLHPPSITHPSLTLTSNSDSFRCLPATLVILITSTPSLL